MQQDKHPDYHPVVFRDRAAGYAFLTRSTRTERADHRVGRRPELPGDRRGDLLGEPPPSTRARPARSTTEGRIARFERRYGGADAGETT